MFRYFVVLQDPHFQRSIHHLPLSTSFFAALPSQTTCPRKSANDFSLSITAAFTDLVWVWRDGDTPFLDMGRIGTSGWAISRVGNENSWKRILDQCCNLLTVFSRCPWTCKRINTRESNSYWFLVGVLTDWAMQANTASIISGVHELRQRQHRDK